MTIRVYCISQFLFCPYKLLLNHIHDEIKVADSKTHLKSRSIVAISKRLHHDFLDMIRMNMWSVERGMVKEDVIEILLNGIPSLIKNASENIIQSFDLHTGEKLEKEWAFGIKIEIEILALKIIKIMNTTRKSGRELIEMMFPPSLNSYLIYDSYLDLVGKVDKIEIMDGNYFPVKIKYGNPPLRGVWDSDALEVVAYALLTEREFETDVNVGFVEYVTLGEKRPVIIDSEIREGFFRVMDEIRDIIYGNEDPEIVINPKKCESCEYSNICEYSGLLSIN
ncbi:MAG: CRISPR-associated protein Cas4 [Euryarchaeota archaeon]|nr:CRISPR-associated protein Cas4 [Euryarchaeota archaeon]MBV1728810.1 CRISPR-associated protein Cas4 [Methanobacterium sp.]MBU4548369.1 CRISPR-associated protein Cas4 [Euryarchaeota archaeon]MBU4608407.1 CRISPR-associated protein Cas4 [Euryarchaeota archaeon]MBV1755471.1 CRISPR-associated protein Cas4 [Methanobacterium sp.]